MIRITDLPNLSIGTPLTHLNAFDELVTVAARPRKRNSEWIIPVTYQNTSFNILEPYFSDWALPRTIPEPT